MFINKDICGLFGALIPALWVQFVHGGSLFLFGVYTSQICLVRFAQT